MAGNEEVQVETIVFNASDGVEVTGDLYLTDNSGATFILLCHQAGYSRGEYATIATELYLMGFNCLAIDLRSGYAFGGVKNETHQSAVSKGMTSGFIDAYADIIAGLKHIEAQYNPKRVILWGSSYSASLAIIIASVGSEGLDAVVTFSPGEYFEFDGQTIAEYAKRVKVPVFIASAKREVPNWEGISESIKSDGSEFFVPEEDGVHGSSALMKETTNHQEYWDALKRFLGFYK